MNLYRRCGLSVCLAAGAISQPLVSTGHYDRERTGANRQEAVLTVANVSSGGFRRIGRLDVQGCVAAQPLYVPNVDVPGIGPRPVVYVATTANFLYAFDAGTLQEYFRRYFGTPVPSAEINPETGYWDFPDCDGVDAQGPVGIVGTPVIDPESRALFLVANEADTQHRHFLYKVDIRTGDDLTPPVQIYGSYGTKVFDSYYQLQRAALLLAEGRVYVAFASHTDATPYSGWMLSYDTNLNLLHTVSYSPEKSGAGIWQSGAGPAYADGRIWVTTGNNAEGLIVPGDNANSILEIDPFSLAVLAQTSFPEEANSWDYDADLDLGSSRVIAVPGTPYAISGSKLGDMFVMNRGDMRLASRFQATTRLSSGFDWTGIYNGLAVWKDLIFVWPSGGGQELEQGQVLTTDVLRSFRLHPDGSVSLVALGQDDRLEVGYQGASLAVSSNGDDPKSAIVWAATPEGSVAWLRRGHLTAYAATSEGVFRKLWSDLDQADAEGEHAWAKFSQPLVANGRVYLPTYSGAVMVYGLVSQ